VIWKVNEQSEPRRARSWHLVGAVRSSKLRPRTKSTMRRVSLKWCVKFDDRSLRPRLRPNPSARSSKGINPVLVALSMGHCEKSFTIVKP